MRTVLTVSMIAYSASVFAHDAQTGWKYEAFCCNGNNHTGDCQMIPEKSVRITQQGYQITLAPGDHRLVTRSHVFKLSGGMSRRSQDGEYHLCLYPNEDTLRCFYAPDMGF